MRHDPERELDSDISGITWLTRDELADQPERWRSELVLQCVDDYLAGISGPLELLR